MRQKTLIIFGVLIVVLFLGLHAVTKQMTMSAQPEAMPVLNPEEMPELDQNTFFMTKKTTSLPPEGLQSYQDVPDTIESVSKQDAAFFGPARD